MRSSENLRKVLFDSQNMQTQDMLRAVLDRDHDRDLS